MADDLTPAAPATGIRGRLTQKIGPLPLWGWAAGATAIAAAYFYMHRSSSSSSSSDSSGTTDSSGYDGTETQPQDFSSGYDSGYAAGLNATGDPGTAGDSSGSGTTTGTGGGTTAPASHNRFCAPTKDPSGKTQTVCGYGTWIKGASGWSWQPGIPPASAIGGGTGGTGTSSGTTGTGTGSAGTGGKGGTGTSSTNPPKATTAQRIAQIIKDLQNPGPKQTAATRASELATYKTLTGHAYTGKLGPLPTGQQANYATV